MCYEKEIKEFKDSFKGRSTGTASFQILRVSEKPLSFRGRACHYMLNDQDSHWEEAVAVITAANADWVLEHDRNPLYTEDQVIQFYDHLLNNSFFSEGALTKDPGFAFCYGIATETNFCPGPMMHGIHLGYRIPWESPKRVRRWCELVWGGVNPDSALIFSGLYSKSAKQIQCDMSGHCVYTPYYISLEGIKNLINHTPKHTDFPFSKEGNYVGVDTSIGVSYDEKDKVQKLLEKTFGDTHKVVGKKEGPFGTQDILESIYKTEEEFMEHLIPTILEVEKICLESTS